MVGYGSILMLIWVRLLIMVGNCFSMGLRGTNTESLLASGNSRNEYLLIASIILSPQTQGRRKILYLPLIKLIMKALCIPVVESNITVILPAINR